MGKQIVWYQKSLDVLRPLRWHLNELIEVMEQHNRYAQRMGLPTLPKSKIAEARKANELANKFFVKQGNLSECSSVRRAPGLGPGGRGGGTRHSDQIF